MTYAPKIGDPWPFRSARGLTGAPMDTAQWMALIVPPQREKRAADTLRTAGVVVGYPTVEKARNIRGKKAIFIRPMISQIIYARFSYRPHFDVMRQRRVITGVFSRGGEPIQLTEDDIARVMGLPTEAERIEAERIEAMRVRPGGKGEIVGGPFSGFLVDVDRVEAGRVWWSMVTGLRGEIAEAMVRKV